MSALFHITRIEATQGFVLYHLDTPKQGHTAIVSFRGTRDDLEPTLATLHRHQAGFDFEIDSSPLPETDDPDDPRLRAACRVHALTLRS